MYPTMARSQSEGARRSVLQASVGARCLVAAAIAALLWLAVAWAMGAV